MENQINLKNFALAGKAIFTVVNESTGNRFTFKIHKANNDQKDIHFVSVLTGADNENCYTYLGSVFDNKEFKITKGSKVKAEAPSFKAFAWIWSHVDNLPSNVKAYHEGRCGRCGRKLTVPESIMSGFGPECINYIRK